MTKKEQKIEEKEQSKVEKEEEEPKVFSASEMINKELILKTKEARDYKEKYLRALADLENTKKRLIAEKQEIVNYSVSNIVEDLLEPIDNLENALSYTDNLSDELKNWATGFKMILNQLQSALENHGIVPYESKGKPFDPHFHEAVEMVETNEEKDGIVLEEIKKGYKHHGKILRVSKVKVAKHVPKENN